MMGRSTKWIMGAGLVAATAAIALGAGTAQAGFTAAATAAGPGTETEAGPEENAVPSTGEALARASAAALASTGGGTVTETEVGDEQGYYEVEVTRADGSQVDVHLDQAFAVLGSEADHEDRPR